MGLGNRRLSFFEDGPFGEDRPAAALALKKQVRAI
jgi:hypothetical protein